MILVVREVVCVQDIEARYVQITSMLNDQSVISNKHLNRRYASI